MAELDNTLQIGEGGVPYSLTQECQDVLRDSWVGWTKAKSICILLGIPYQEPTVEGFIEATITDVGPDNPSPCPVPIRNEIRNNLSEAYKYVAGLMGVV